MMRCLPLQVLGLGLLVVAAHSGCGNEKAVAGAGSGGVFGGGGAIGAAGSSGTGGAFASGGAGGNVSATGGMDAPGTGGVNAPGTGGATAPVTVGLGYNGAVSFLRATPLLALSDPPGQLAVVAPAQERVEISAPILPRVSVLYPAEGAAFPTTDAGRAALAHQAALTFDFLRDDCAMRNPHIIVRGPTDPPTTAEENAANYDAIATCAYQDFVSKPYWIPTLVATVDICAAELGSTWRPITEADLANFSNSDAGAVAASLSTPGSAGSFGNFYFGLGVWVRGAGGTLRRGDLSPNVSPRVTDLAVAADSTTHYESGLSLRCIRVTSVP